MSDLFDDIKKILIDYRWSLDSQAITKNLIASGKYRDYKSMRLSQVAKILNKGLSTIAHFLSIKGFEVEINPNTKINIKQLKLLGQEFNSTELLKLVSEDNLLIPDISNVFSTVKDLSVDDIEAIIKNNRIFRIEPNGSVSLRYDETFRNIEKSISTIFRTWNSNEENENTFIMLFLIKLLSSVELANKLNIPESLLRNGKFKDRLFITISYLNSINELFRNSFSDIINKWNKHWDWDTFEKILPEVESIPKKLYGRYFSDFTRTSAHKDWVGFYEPNPVMSELMAQLVQVIKPKIVYDPFAGMGDFVVEISKLLEDGRYILGDNNSSVGRIGKINLILNGVYNFKYSIQDSLSDDRKTVKADLIVTNPPFGTTDRKISDSLPFKKTDNSFTTHALLSILNDIASEGHAFIIVPEGFLFHPNQQEVRNYMVRNGWLKTVISLPTDLLRPFSGVKVSILHLQKTTHNKREDIRFIKNDISPSSSKDFNKYITNITLKFNKKTAENKDIISIPVARILAENGELLANRYGIDDNSNYGNYSVRQLVKENLNGVNYRKDTVIKDQKKPYVIRQNDLPKVVEDIYIDISQAQKYLIVNGDNSSPIKHISQNHVLFPRFGSRFYPALYDSNEKAVIDGTTVIGIKVDTEKVLPEYFVYQFYETAVEQQIKQFATTFAHLLKISETELYRVRLNIPSISEQKRYIKNKKQSAIRDVKITNDEVAYERFSSLKHSMATPLDVIEGDINTLFEFLEEHIQDQSPITGEDYVVNMLDESQRKEWEDKRLYAYKERIKRNVGFLKDSLRKVDDLIRANKPLQFDKVNLRELWKEVLEDNNDSIYSYKINGGGSTRIEADKHLLKSAFSYLVENTIKHGFLGKKSIDYQEVIVDLEEQPDDQILIWYRNNGRPFAEDFDLESIFERGRTSDNKSGSGFGGFVLHQIIARHDGEIQPFSLAQDPYPVQFKISLPLSHDY